MSKLTAIILSFLLLGQSIQISATDVLQLDDLYMHTIEHYQKTGDSLIEFFSLHYGNQKITHSKEHSQHQNLPFQQDVDILNSSIFYLQENSRNSASIVLYLDVQSHFYCLDFHSTFEFQPLIQPPINV